MRMGAKRLEVAHTQYYGWAYVNRAALMPNTAQVDESIRIVEAARERLKGQLVIDLVVPDYYAKYPKACAGGWGRKLMNVTPQGKVLPCHAAETIPGLEFWNVNDRSLGEIWRDSQALRRRLGTALAQRDPIRQSSALPRGRNNSRAGILERLRPFARRDLA